jgi:hypothetical protein
MVALGQQPGLLSDEQSIQTDKVGVSRHSQSQQDLAVVG